MPRTTLKLQKSDAAETARIEPSAAFPLTYDSKAADFLYAGAPFMI